MNGPLKSPEMLGATLLTSLYGYLRLIFRNHSQELQTILAWGTSWPLLNTAINSRDMSILGNETCNDVRKLGTAKASHFRCLPQ